MKKLLTSALLAIFLCTALFASTSASGTLQLSGYKNNLSNSGLFLIDVKYLDSNSLVQNVPTDVDITSNLKSNTTLSNAFAVTILSNLRYEVDVNMTFTPFINQTDSSDTVPVTYNYSSDSISDIEGETTIYAYLTYGRRTYLTSMLMKYGAEMSFTNSNDREVTSLSVNNTTTATLKLSIDSVYFKESDSSDSWNDNGTTVPQWRDSNGEIIETDVLPGFSDSQMFTGKSYFTLSVSDTSDFKSDTKYIATVVFEMVVNN